MWFRFRSCRKCHGDLVLDGEDWKCWQCGRYYYSTPPATDVPPEPAEPSIAGQPRLALGKTVTGPRNPAEKPCCDGMAWRITSGL